MALWGVRWWHWTKWRTRTPNSLRNSRKSRMRIRPRLSVLKFGDWSEVSKYLTTMPMCPTLGLQKLCRCWRCQMPAHFPWLSNRQDLYTTRALASQRRSISRSTMWQLWAKCQIIRRNSCKTRQGWDNWETSSLTPPLENTSVNWGWMTFALASYLSS